MQSCSLSSQAVSSPVERQGRVLVKGMEPGDPLCLNPGSDTIWNLNFGKLINLSAAVFSSQMGVIIFPVSYRIFARTNGVTMNSS